MMNIMRFFVPLFMTLFVVIHIGVIGWELSGQQVKDAAKTTVSSKINEIEQKTASKMEYPKTTTALIKLLGDRSKWFSYRASPLIEKLPVDFSKLAPAYRKRVFIAAILPLAVTVKKQFDAEHRYVIDINNKIRENIPINANDIKRLDLMFNRYNIKGGSLKQRLKKLSLRSGSVPISLLLAQAAVESNWGASRFAIYGNNLFGIRTYHSDGMKPKTRSRYERNFKVVAYKNLGSSIKSYIINFNTGWAYKGLRKTREALFPKENPYKMADNLRFYSIKRDGYVKMIKYVISKNDLGRFDKTGNNT